MFRQKILSHCDLRNFAPGETIYAQGDKSGGLWGLADGTVGIELSGQHRDPTFAFLTNKGFWIGAPTLVMGAERQVGLVALRPSTLLHLPKSAFLAMTQQDPEVWRWLSVLPLLQNVLAFGVLEDLLIRDPRRRCAAILLRLAGCRGPLAVAEPEEVFATQEQLAEMINMSRTALGEVLRDFEAKGLILRRYGKMTVDRLLLEGVLSKV